MTTDRPGRCVVLGVLDVTSAACSDDDDWSATERAVARGMALAAAGADHVDVGSASCRPGADRVDEAEEVRRVVPVVGELAAAGVAVSVDTTRARVAAAAIDAGAVLVDDVSGGHADPTMADVVAATGVTWVLGHRRGPGRTVDAAASHRDVVREACGELRARVDAALAAGVGTGQLVLGLDPADDLTLLAHLEEFVARGLPVLVGASCGDAAPLVTAVLAAQAGAWGVRVHDAAAAADAVRVVTAVRQAG